jgi:hypothetical protein
MSVVGCKENIALRRFFQSTNENRKCTLPWKLSTYCRHACNFCFSTHWDFAVIVPLRLKPFQMLPWVMVWWSLCNRARVKYNFFLFVVTYMHKYWLGINDISLHAQFSHPFVVSIILFHHCNIFYFMKTCYKIGPVSLNRYEQYIYICEFSFFLSNTTKTNTK